MTRRFASCFALLAVVICAQQGSPVFHATSELVLLDVQVVHRKTGTAFGQLHAKDFVISEDGVPQKIAFFGRDTLPLSVLLLFDLTQSDRRVLHHFADGAQSALEHLKYEDEVAVMAYAASTTLVDGFTQNRARSASAISRAAAMKDPEDAAFFNEAMYEAAAFLETAANPSSRRVILWLTDNLPNEPTPEMLRYNDKGLDGAMPRTEAEAIRKLHESGAVVMPLLLKDRLWMAFNAAFLASESRYRKQYPPGDARKYAEITGGFPASLRGKDVQQRLAEDIDNLRNLYTIGYRPSESKPPGTFCHVTVSLAPAAPLRPQEWKVLARAGYYRK